jgi:glucose-6-phosphate isomerase
VNAYHQPGVEAGKKAAQAVLDVQAKVVAVLKKELGRELSLEEIATGAGGADLTTVFCVLRHLSANPERGILRRIPDGKSVLDAVYVLK